MAALVARVREVDVATFETASREEIATALRPRTATLLDQANSLVGRVLHACDERPVVADVAFLAQADLRQRKARIAGLGPSAPTVVLIECDGALRVVRKSLCAVDRALSTAYETPTYLDSLTDLETSILVRKCYAKFRSNVFVGCDGSNAPSDVYARLRRTGEQIAVVIGLPVYPMIRFVDRMQFRGLQERILTWVRSPTRDEFVGICLWQDVCAFASMLGHVNRRQELMEHDANVMFDTLRGIAGQIAVSAVTLADLRRLEGRDDDLDALLADGTREAREWAPLLARLIFEMGRQLPSSTP